MDELVWLALLVLAFPVMAVVSLVTALKQRNRLAVLEQRVIRLEAALAAADIPATREPRSLEPRSLEPRSPEPMAEPVSPPVQERAHRPAPVPPPRPTPVARPDLWRLARDNLSGLEEKVGARWAVWVGGLALALGGAFLVRVAVEQNLIGPVGRVGLALLLAAALLGAGEALRRLDRRQRVASGALNRALTGLPAVPSLVTAIGTMTAFGSLYAAYELYALLSPPIAFALLGLTAMATVFAALLHGPALAALGFAGAAVTPFLVSSDTPNAWGVAFLIMVVGAAALTVARLRLWHWFALLALGGMGAWGVTLLLFTVPQAVPATGALALTLLALTALLLTPGHLYGPRSGGRPDALATLGCALALGIAVYAASEGAMAALPLTIAILVLLGALLLAWRAPAASFAALAVAVAAPVILAAWTFPPVGGSALAPAGPVAGVVQEPPRLAAGTFALYGAGMGLLLLALGILGARRAPTRLLSLAWAAAGTVGPVLLLIAAYGRLAEFERSLPFALLALVLAALFTATAEHLTRWRLPHGAAAFAAGGVVSLALTLTFALEKGWLTVGLALAALGVAWVSTQRPLPGLRQLSAGLGLVVLGRIGWDPGIAGADLGTTPLFNWLAWGYGVPALAFAAAARLLAKHGDDWSRRTLEGLALIFAVLLAALEVHHLAHGGDLYASGTRLFETGLLAAIYAAYSVGLSRLAVRTGRAFHRLLADIATALAAACALAALFIDNPFLTGEAVGGAVFNDLMVAYALPALLALALAAVQPPERRAVRLLSTGLAVVLAMAYATFEVSRLFQGPVLDPERIGAGEWYAYSATWLGFGILLLGLGLWRGTRSLRLASAAVMMVTVVKVFLSDMSDLEGVLRALSFIGLGLVLVAMGWLYQRLLARGSGKNEEG